MVRHLGTVDGTLCSSVALLPDRTGMLARVTCRRCLSRLEQAVEEVKARGHVDRRRAAAEAVGMGDVWDFVAQRDDADSRAMLESIAMVAHYLQETGYAGPAGSNHRRQGDD